MEKVASPNMTLREFLRMLRRRKATVIICIVALVGASVAYDFAKTPEYTATTQLQLLPQLSTALLEANNSSLANSSTSVDVPTDIQVLQSASIANQVAKKVTHAPRAAVTQVGITDVVDVSVTSPNPHLAARAANAYAESYIATQQYVSVASLANASKQIQARLNTLQSEIDSLQGQLASASPAAQASISNQLNSLQTSQATLRSQLATYEVAAALTTGGGQVISRAVPPSTPSAPKPLEYALYALLAGIVLGVLIAGLQEYLDEKLRSVDELEAVIGDTPVIGLVPSVSEWRDKSSPYLVTKISPKAPPAEAYRSLRTSLQFLGLDDQVKTILLTSTRSAEGKTTTVANLSVAMAETDQTVVAVDCDLRRPRLHKFFGLRNAVGFSTAVVGNARIEDALFGIPGVPNLKVMPSGLIPPNPSELLSSKRAQDALDSLEDASDILLLDCPPILPVTDAVALAARADAVVIVASAGTTTKRDLRRTLETLGRVEARIAGVVMNRALSEDAYADYRYSYYESSDEIEDGVPAIEDPTSNGRAGTVQENGFTRRRTRAR